MELMSRGQRGPVRGCVRGMSGVWLVAVIGGAVL